MFSDFLEINRSCFEPLFIGTLVLAVFSLWGCRKRLGCRGMAWVWLGFVAWLWLSRFLSCEKSSSRYFIGIIPVSILLLLWFYESSSARIRLLSLVTVMVVLVGGFGKSLHVTSKQDTINRFIALRSELVPAGVEAPIMIDFCGWGSRLEYYLDLPCDSSVYRSDTTFGESKHRVMETVLQSHDWILFIMYSKEKKLFISDYGDLTRNANFHWVSNIPEINKLAVAICDNRTNPQFGIKGDKPTPMVTVDNTNLVLSEDFTGLASPEEIPVWRKFLAVNPQLSFSGVPRYFLPNQGHGLRPRDIAKGTINLLLSKEREDSTHNAFSFNVSGHNGFILGGQRFSGAEYQGYFIGKLGPNAKVSFMVYKYGKNGKYLGKYELAVFYGLNGNTLRTYSWSADLTVLKDVDIIFVMELSGQCTINKIKIYRQK